MYCLIETIEAQIFGDALQGGKVQVGAAHLRSSPAHLSASTSSSVILVTVPVPTGAATIEAER
jgi:hypothetical protein